MSGFFPFSHQHDAMDCGATCLRMIAKYYGKNYSLETLREKTSISREGVSLWGISKAAEQIGFRTLGVRVSKEQRLEKRKGRKRTQNNNKKFLTTGNTEETENNINKKNSVFSVSSVVYVFSIINKNF
jgi:ABC-type bacteriocin/lantibiotic exporter with double-glycine peptidase domain